MLDLFEPPVATSSKVAPLEQYQTPVWAADALADLFFTNLDRRGVSPKRVLEPSCGHGRLLHAIPDEIDAYGIEIDPESAARGRENTHRDIYVDDFLISATPERAECRPDNILGNPPFRIEMVRGFLNRAAEILPEGGCAGFLLPAYSFQHTHTVLEWAKAWNISQWMVPRDMFPFLSVPILFAIFQKDYSSGDSKIEGFALYEATHRVKGLPRMLKNLLINGVPTENGLKPTWRVVVEQSLRSLGGEASLKDIYRAVEPMRHTQNQYWREKVRQILQKGPFERSGDTWRLAA